MRAVALVLAGIAVIAAMRRSRPGQVEQVRARFEALETFKPIPLPETWDDLDDALLEIEIQNRGNR